MAQEAKHYIDDYFKERLYDYSPPAPDDMWMKINNSSKKRKKIALWVTFGSMAASLTIIISLGIGYYIGSTNTRKHLSLQENIKQQNTTFSTSENSDKTIEKTIKPNSLKTDESTSHNIIEQNVTIKVKDVNINKESKEVSTPYYIKEKAVHLNKIKMASLNKLPERRSSRLMTSKEVYAYYFENDNNSDVLAEQPKNHKNNWELGGVMAPLYSKWNVQSNNLYTNEYVNSVETAVLAYSGGLNVSFSSSRWKFESGINYSWSNQDLGDVAENLRVVKVNSYFNYRTDANDPIKINDEPNSVTDKLTKPANSITNNSSGVYFLKSKKEPNTTYFITNNSKSYEEAFNAFPNKNNTSEINRSMEQSSKYLVIPFIAHYKIIDKKADVFLSGGFSTNILIKAKRRLELENTTYELDSLMTNKTFNYSGILGINVEIPVLEKLSVKVEPCINYNLNSIEKSNYARVYPYSLGIYSGIFYKF